MTRWERMVLSAWLRRVLSLMVVNPWDRVVEPESPDYHPPKAARIYRRYQKIIDKHA